MKFSNFKLAERQDLQENVKTWKSFGKINESKANCFVIRKRVSKGEVYFILFRKECLDKFNGLVICQEYSSKIKAHS